MRRFSYIETCAVGSFFKQQKLNTILYIMQKNVSCVRFASLVFLYAYYYTFSSTFIHNKVIDSPGIVHDFVDYPWTIVQ